MHIWVDADACPRVIKEILYRAAERVRVPLTLVANKSLWIPPSRFIRSVRVEAGFDVADRKMKKKNLLQRWKNNQGRSAFCLRKTFRR